MEFEAKVLLSQEQYYEAIEKYDVVMSRGHCRKDYYYTKFNSTEEAKKNGESLTRIRVDDGVCYLTLKKKEFEGGFENNVELETKVAKKRILEIFLREAGYKEYFRKYKSSNLLESYKINNTDAEIHVELVSVSGGKDKRYWALEIECSDPSDIVPVDIARQKVLEAFNKYGFSEKDFETRDWKKLIEG